MRAGFGGRRRGVGERAAKSWCRGLGLNRIWKLQRARDVVVDRRKGGAFLGSAATRRWCTAFWVKQSGGRRRRLTAGRARRSQADASYLISMIWSSGSVSQSTESGIHTIHWAGAVAIGWSDVRKNIVGWLMAGSWCWSSVREKYC